MTYASLKPSISFIINVALLFMLKVTKCEISASLYTTLKYSSPGAALENNKAGYSTSDLVLR